MRRLTLSVLLPLLLLLSQQGALLHEWSHWHFKPAAAVQQVESAHVDSDICLTCLAFAQIAGLAKFDVAAMPAAPGLRYHYVAVPSRDVAEAASPAVRNRGPPRFL